MSAEWDRSAAELDVISTVKAILDYSVSSGDIQVSVCKAGASKSSNEKKQKEEKTRGKKLVVDNEKGVRR